MIVGGVAASRGHINIVTLIVVVVACAIAGDSVGYWVGREVGPPTARRPAAPAPPAPPPGGARPAETPGRRGRLRRPVHRLPPCRGPRPGRHLLHAVPDLPPRQRGRRDPLGNGVLPTRLLPGPRLHQGGARLGHRVRRAPRPHRRRHRPPVHPPPAPRAARRSPGSRRAEGRGTSARAHRLGPAQAGSPSAYPSPGPGHARRGRRRRPRRRPAASVSSQRTVPDGSLRSMPKMPETRLVAAPLVIVHQRPVQVSGDRRAVGHGVGQRGEVLPDIAGTIPAVLARHGATALHLRRHAVLHHPQREPGTQRGLGPAPCPQSGRVGRDVPDGPSEPPATAAVGQLRRPGICTAWLATGSYQSNPTAPTVRSWDEEYTTSTTATGHGSAGGGAQPRPERAAARALVGAVRAQRGIGRRSANSPALRGGKAASCRARRSSM